MKKQTVFLAITTIFTLFIFMNSLMSGEVSSAQSGLITIPLTNFLNYLFGLTLDASSVSLVIRKLAHFGEFLILGVLWVLTLTSYSFRLQKAMQLTISIGLLTALSDEFIQTFVPGRAGTLLDVLIDLVGVLVGVFIITGIIKQIEHKKTSP